MLSLYWNETLIVSVPRETYKNSLTMRKAFAKLLNVNMRYLSVVEDWG